MPQALVVTPHSNAYYQGASARSKQIVGLPRYTIACQKLFCNYRKRSVMNAKSSLVLCLAAVLLLLSSSIAGDNPKHVRAARITTPVVVDGFLNDAQWLLAEPATGFTQRDPDEGQPATEPSEIRVLYDDENIYFGCMFYDSEPDKIVARLTRRDNEIETDGASVRIDSFHDQQNCYEFTFNPAGVKVDILQYDDANKEDVSWDVVWDIHAHILSNGWSAEIRIPLSVLRYRSETTSAEGQEWGINFLRHVSRKNEDSRWAFTPKSQSGFVSRFGHLTGLVNLPTSRRAELLPFTLAKQDWQPRKFNRRAINEFSGNAGLDFKYSLSNNFLIDATINPDFGQVEADPAVLNLSTLETFYPEKRPFFIEGTQIIRFTTFGDAFGPGMFYSRRIGRPLNARDVRVPVGAEIVDLPQATTILGAAKISGKTDGGTSIGVLQAFTKEMRATVADSTGRTSEQVVEPFAHYNVIRLRKDVLDNSVVGVIMTTTAKERRLPGVTAGVDWNLKFEQNTFQLDGFFGYSYSNHLLERGTRGTGLAGKLNFERIAAEHWLWSASVDFTSKGYNINDVGFFNRPNDFGFFGKAKYKEDRPGDVVRSYHIDAFFHERENFDNVNLFRQVNISANLTFTNYWNLAISSEADAGKYDDRETRSNGLYRKPAVYQANLGVSTDGRKDVFGSLSFHTGWDSKRKFAWGPTFGIEFKPVSWMEYELNAGYNHTRNQEAWVENVLSGNGAQSIFADRTTKQVNLTLRSTITFTRDLTLQFYGQVFLAKGHYENFKRLIGEANFTPVNYTSNPDFNGKFLNTNLVLRWEYLPGSTLFLVWSQAREGGSGAYFTSFGEDVRSTFRTPPSNVLLLKVSYWWNM